MYVIIINKDSQLYDPIIEKFIAKHANKFEIAIFISSNCRFYNDFIKIYENVIAYWCIQNFSTFEEGKEIAKNTLKSSDLIFI